MEPGLLRGEVSRSQHFGGSPAREAPRSPTLWDRRRPAAQPRWGPSDSGRMLVKCAAGVWWAALGCFSGVDRLKWGVCEASLPRLTAQELCWSARRPPSLPPCLPPSPPDNNPAASPPLGAFSPCRDAQTQSCDAGRARLRCARAAVCVALRFGDHHSPGSPRGAQRKSGTEAPGGGLLVSGEPPPSHLSALRWESARLGATVQRLRGAWLVRCWRSAMEGSFHKRAEARQHHAEPRRTEPGCCCCTAAAGGGTPPLLLFTRVPQHANTAR